MKKKNTKFPLPLWERVRVRGGISAVSLIFALVLMISLGAFFISLMLGKHIGAPLLAQSTKALYIADAGIEFAAIRLRDFIVPGDVDWSDNVTDIPSTPFGDGAFAVAFNKTANSVTANSTGTSGNATRVISTRFTRQAVLMSNPVNWVSKIKIGPGVTVNSPPPCTQCQDLGCLGNPCATPVTLAQAPPPTPPSLTNATWSCPPTPGKSYSGTVTISGDCTFNAGTYYFDELEIQNNANVTVTGPVTIWIEDRFRLRDNATFNSSGSVANVLLLAANPPNTTDAKFRLDNAVFRGAIYAPNGEKVEIKGNTQVFGAITGDDVELENTTITFDSNAGLNAMIDASGWGEM